MYIFVVRKQYFIVKAYLCFGFVNWFTERTNAVTCITLSYYVYGVPENACSC